VQEKPTPYRHCLGNALINAEMLRVFLRPQNRIVMANFWQFANEYWGQVKGYVHKGDPLVKRPQYFPFELYHNHFGAELLDARVECGRYETDGGWGVAPARGEGSRFELVGKAVALSEPWKIGDCKGVKQRAEGDALIAEFAADAGDVNYFHARKFIPAEPKTGYRLTAWIKTEELTSAKGACFQIGDARGWVATKSSAMTRDVRGTKDWTKVEADYATLPDTKEIEVIARRLSGGGIVTGRAWYRDLQVQKFTPQHYAAVPHLSVNASRSRDGRKVFLIIVNKHLDAPVTATINIASFKPHRARAWSLTGPSVDATNEKDPTFVTVKERDLGAVKNGFPVEFPPHSMTAIEVE
jgi:alpha-N-arabinofuranosidase